MAGSVLERTVAQPVHFQDRAGGTVLDGKLESVRVFVPDHGERELVLVVWFDYWTYKRIDRAHLFGYTFESIDREGLQGYEFVSNQPMQLELRAQGAALATIDDLDATVAALTGSDPSSPLLDAANYLYLAVYQSKGAYLSGFTSVYKKRG